MPPWIVASTRSPTRRLVMRQSRGGGVVTSFASTSNATTTTTTTSTTTSTAAAATTATSVSSRIKAYSDLAKAKLSALVVTTTAAGFIAAGEPIYAQLDVLLSCVAGTALCSASAAAANQIIERQRDALMKRTQPRPLVTGALSVSQAQRAALLWGTTGTALLAGGTDPLTTALGVGNILLYAGLYTALKTRTVYNTPVGAVVGAVPPLMGWTAATAYLTAAGNPSAIHTALLATLATPDPWLLAALLYFWQLPHFYALNFMYRLDYARGGFAMLACQDSTATARQIVANTWFLSAVPWIAAYTATTSTMFAYEGCALNAYALYVAYQFRLDPSNANARRVFRTSLWYLPVMLSCFLLHTKAWDRERSPQSQPHLLQQSLNHLHGKRDGNNPSCDHDPCPLLLSSSSSSSPSSLLSPPSPPADDCITQWIARQVHTIRDWGRMWCIHEVAADYQQQQQQQQEGPMDQSQGHRPPPASSCVLLRKQQEAKLALHQLKNEQEHKLLETTHQIWEEKFLTIPTISSGTTESGTISTPSIMTAPATVPVLPTISMDKTTTPVQAAVPNNTTASLHEYRGHPQEIPQCHRSIVVVVTDQPS